MNVIVILGVIALLVALNFIRTNILGWLAAWWIALYVGFRYGITPPLPASIINMFMAIVTLALLAYLFSSTDHIKTAKDRIVRFMVQRKYLVPLILVLVALPSLVALKVYIDVTERPQPPLSGRTIHPPPPASINFKGTTIQLASAENPFRELETSKPTEFEEHVENGRRVYHENCVFCHGDDMRGNGIYAHGLDPIPANFQDPTTIAMLQESYLFWRISKGAPGLPEESTPWASAMPAWELFLDEEEIWDVILFLYEYTGYEPREREEIH